MINPLRTVSEISRFFSHNISSLLVLFWLSIFNQAPELVSVESRAVAYREVGLPAYRIHDLRDLGSGFRPAEFGRDALGRLLLVSGGHLWNFDGGEWQELYVSGDDINCSGVVVDPHGRIYLGGSGDWGYLEKEPGKDYVYHSLKNTGLENHNEARGDYFDLELHGTQVGFMGENSFVLLNDDGESTVFSGLYRLTAQFSMGDDIYLATEYDGLFRIENGELVKAGWYREDEFPEEAIITSASHQSADSVILGINGVGVAAFDGDTLRLIPCDLEALKNCRIHDIVETGDGAIALTLDGWGFVIIDRDGRVLKMIHHEADRQFIRSQNLHDNEDGSLWVTVANGIAQVIYPSAISYFGHQQKLPISWPSVFRYEGKLLVQSNRILYQGVYDREGFLEGFEKREELQGRLFVDMAYPVDGEGIFFSEGESVYLQPPEGELYQVAQGFPVRYFHLHPDFNDCLFLLNHEGVYVLEKKAGRWRYGGKFFESQGIFNQVHIRDREGKFWSERGPGRIVKYWLDENRELRGRNYGPENGLADSWINLYKINGKPHISFSNQHFRYNSETDLFEKDDFLGTLSDEIQETITRVFEYAPDHWIVTTSSGVVLVDMKDDGRMQFDFNTFAAFPEFNPLVLTDIEDEIWLRSESSLARFQPELVAAADRVVEVKIDRVRMPGSESEMYSIDDLVSGGEAVKIVFPYHRGGLQFHFYSTVNDRLNPMKYRYYLEGLSDGWSELNSQTNANFVGIPEGDYTLMVEAVDHFGRTGQMSYFSFTVTPPWYRERLAYALYVFIFLLGMMLTIYSIRVNAKRENRRLAELVAEKTAEHERAAHEAQEASKAKSRFLANMSHEIRTPINGILGTGELLESSELNNEQNDLVRIVKSSAASLLEVVEDILNFSKIEAGKIQLREVRFVLEDLVMESLRVVSNRSLQKRLDLFYTLDNSGEYELIGDEGHLKQVIINLVENALKFTTEGFVKVECKVEPVHETDLGMLSITIIDTGIGIPAEKQKSLFDPFYQIDDSNTRLRQGTGLGLSISRGLMEKMGGKLELESVVGQGTRVSIRVPLPLVAQPAGNEVKGGFPERIIWATANQRVGAEVAESFNRMGVHIEVVDGLETLRQVHCNEEDGSYKSAYFVVEQEDSRLFSNLSACLSRGYENEMIAGFTILSYPDIHFSDTLAKHVVYKPWSYRRIIRTLTGGENVSGKADHSKSGQLGVLSELASRKILIVEDNKVNHKVLELILKKQGVESSHAWNGVEACEMMDQLAYDLIFMDVQMPEMDGLEATQILKQKRRSCYIIGISASARDTDQETAIDSGMDDFLTKPVGRLTSKMLFEDI